MTGKVVHLLLKEGRGLLLLVEYGYFLLLGSPALLPLVGVLLVVMPEPLFFPGLLLSCVGGVFAGIVLLSLNYLSVVLESLLCGVPSVAEWAAVLFQDVLAYELADCRGCQPIGPRA